MVVQISSRQSKEASSGGRRLRKEKKRKKRKRKQELEEVACAVLALEWFGKTFAWLFRFVSSVEGGVKWRAPSQKRKEKKGTQELEEVACAVLALEWFGKTCVWTQLGRRKAHRSARCFQGTFQWLNCKQSSG